jgi:hypothetical protein
MYEHTYHNFKDAILHSCDYRCRGDHLIHCYFHTIFYNQVVWC